MSEETLEITPAPWKMVCMRQTSDARETLSLVHVLCQALEQKSTQKPKSEGGGIAKGSLLSDDLPKISRKWHNFWHSCGGGPRMVTFLRPRHLEYAARFLLSDKGSRSD